jgi:tRNA wybutosine-synthesizing protein 4
MAVQGTNDSSTLSKSSAVRSGYFRDEFITFFVGKQTRRSSLIHRGYYVRVLAVDSIVQHFLRSTSGPLQIISFGAGFDSTFFRLKSRGALTDTVYVEVDFPDVVARKVVMIKGQRKLNELLEHPLQQRQEVYTSPGYSMIGLDLEHVEKLSGFLPQCGVEFDRPTLLLSECVLTYITDKSANRIISWSASTFPNALFVTYEQVHPNDGFGLVMQKHFTTIGSPLKCINVYPTPQTQEERYLRMVCCGRCTL